MGIIITRSLTAARPNAARFAGLSLSESHLKSLAFRQDLERNGGNVSSPTQPSEPTMESSDTTVLKTDNGATAKRPNLMKHPLVIGAITVTLLVFWVMPMLVSTNEATHEQYQTLSVIAASTQCQQTKDAIMNALDDDRLTSSEYASIAGHSKSITCDRDRIVADILQSVR